MTATACRVLFAGRAGWMARGIDALCTAARLEQAGPAVQCERLLEAVQRDRPHVVLLDLESAGTEALVAIESVMAERPTPILLLVPQGADRQEAMRALSAGALDVLERPVRLEAEFARVLEAHARLLSRVAVVSHPRGRRRHRQGAKASGAAFPLVAIAASLGGPRALVGLLAALPKDFPAAVVLCQHITPGFADDLARWLASAARRVVREAEPGERLVAGTTFVAPSDAHLKVTREGTLEFDPGPAVGGFKPSCDVLLSSAAEAFGDRCVGVVLTGMGRDGAAGLLEIRRRGGHTLVQDEATSVVFGMPGEAIALGAAELVLPLEEIAGQLAKWCAR